MEMLFADCMMNAQANYILIFKIKLIQHVVNSSLYIDVCHKGYIFPLCVCAHRNSAYLVVIQPQLGEQQRMAHMYVNR